MERKEYTKLKSAIAAALNDKYWYAKQPDGTFALEIYADYRDEMDPKTAAEICQSSDPALALLEKLEEWYFEAEAVYQAELEKEIRDTLTASDGPYPEGLGDTEEECLSDTIRELAYWVYPESHFLKQEFNVDILLDTGDGNYDFTFNSPYPCWYGDYDARLDEKSSLLWLSRQQGYSKTKLWKALREGNMRDPKGFLQSCRVECANLPSSMAAVTFLVRMTLARLIELNRYVRLLRHFHGISFPEAVRYLLDFNGCSVDSPISPPIQRTRPPPYRERPHFVLPPPNGDNERVIAYLRGRGIGPGVIDHFIGDGLLYEDAAHHNCVFVGRNNAGKPVFAAKRGTWGSFKGDAVGSNKKIGFRLPCDPALDTVHVFESPIDLMSWLTLYGLPVSNAVALCGLWDGPLETYLKENPCLRRITLCLDADEPGRKAAQKLSSKYQALSYQVETRFPPSGEDWNECLKKIMGKAG